MENPTHTEEANGLTIKIYQDDTGDSPDDWGDNGMFLVGYHRDFWVEGPRVYSGQAMDPKDKGHCLFTKEEVIEIARAGYKHKDFWVFPLEAYIHSGVRLYLSGGCQIDRAREAIAREEEKEALLLWRSGGNLSRHFTATALRIKEDHVETSRGAKVPITRARELAKMIQEEKDIRGFEIDGFTVISFNGVLKIGCHEIPKEEIEAIIPVLLK